MNTLGARTKKARAAAQFTKVLTSDKQGRVVKVLLPGSEAKQYEVILRRNGHLSAECNLTTAIGRKPCQGNQITLCYHALAAVIVAARASDSAVSFCDRREHAESLAHLGHAVYPVESWNAGPGRGLWVAVRGKHEELNPQTASASEPQPDKIRSEAAVESGDEMLDVPALVAAVKEAQRQRDLEALYGKA